MRNMILASLAFLLASPAAWSCPNLDGTYKCPGEGDEQPDQLVTIQSLTLAGNTIYRMKYESTLEQSVVLMEASKEGVLNTSGNAALAAVCTDRALVLKPDGLFSEGTDNFLNEQGDLIAERAGSVLMVCKKIKAQ